MGKTKVTAEEVMKIAKLANLTLTDEELKKFPEQFSQTIEVINQLNEIDTTGTANTAQVTGLVNVTREDGIDSDRMLSQKEALSQARRTHNGFFVVKKILDKE